VQLTGYSVPVAGISARPNSASSFSSYHPQSETEHNTVYLQPLKMELTHGSETSAQYILTPENTQKNIYNIQITAKA
jgi:hypothetical protein